MPVVSPLSVLSELWRNSLIFRASQIVLLQQISSPRQSVPFEAFVFAMWFAFFGESSCKWSVIPFFFFLLKLHIHAFQSDHSVQD